MMERVRCSLEKTKTQVLWCKIINVQKTLKKLKITLFFIQVGTVIDKRLKYPEFFVLLSKRRFDDV